MKCSLCERVELIANGSYPYFIHEFKNSYLMLGEHQFYKGYCVLISKSHHREMADISSPEREEIFQEMMTSSKLIQTFFMPKKMNLCSLGNVVEHLHWHFFPRYKDDPLLKNPPWLQMHRFDEAKLTPVEAVKMAELLKDELKKL